MVEVGQLSIKGTLDNSNIKRGQREISSGFDTMKQKTQSTFGSMNLLAGSAKSLGNALVTVSGVATTGLMALAGLTPTLAPEFAKLKIETFKLSNIVGQELKPAFENVTTAYSNFVNFLGSGTELANFSSDLLVMVGAGGALSLFANKLLGIKGLGKILIPIAIAFSIEEPLQNIAQKGTESVLSALGYESDTSFMKQKTEVAQDFGGFLGTTVAGAAGGGIAGSLFGGVGAIPGALIGAILGASKGLYDIIKDDYFSDADTIG